MCNLYVGMFNTIFSSFLYSVPLTSHPITTMTINLIYLVWHNIIAVVVLSTVSS